MKRNVNDIVDDILSIIDRNGFTTDEIENVESVREELLDFIYELNIDHNGEDILSHGLPF